MRRILNQAAHAAVKGSYFQAVFRRLVPRLGYKGAVWALAHRLCRLPWKILHDGIRLNKAANPIRGPNANGLRNCIKPVALAEG